MLPLNSYTILIALIGIGADFTLAQSYPSRPIRIVTSQIGGGNDVVARLMGPALSKSMGQQVVIDNRPSGPISPQVVSKAQPDGHTILIASSSFWIGPLLQDMSYDVIRDFMPVTITSEVTNVVVVPISLPVKSVKELIALAKAKPGELNYSSGQSGGGANLAVELFKHMAGVNIVRIVYKGGSLALIDLIAGRVQMTINDAPTLMGSVKAGKLRGLAITSLKPSSLYPDFPTVAASGLPGYESGAIQAAFVPAQTPQPIVNRLNQEIVRYLKTPEAKAQFLNAETEVVGSSAQELSAKLKEELATWGKVIKDAGIKIE